MINFRVADLDAMLAQLRAAGSTVSDEISEASYGRFGWATDPDGNRFELWQPAADLSQRNVNRSRSPAEGRSS